MAKIDQLFKAMAEQKASDLHLTAGSAPHLRLNGEMVALDMPLLSNEEVQVLIFEILSEKQKRQFIENWELDCSYNLESVGRFRVNVFMQRKGMGAVFRMIPSKIKSVEELGLPPELLDLIKIHKGLICVTGPTGSGKSTTLAALINHIATTTAAHIITVEDPIEFTYNNTRSLVNQREVGGHTKSFANALKAALREDPDIILVGEMRDLETIQLAITAAETGHLVFGTLHTSSAAKTIDRIIDVFPDSKAPQIRAMLSESLRGVIAQTLLPRADVPGRVAAIEVMTNTRAIASLIRDGKTFQIPSTMQISRNAGCMTFENAIEGLLQQGRISQATANEVLGTNKPEKESSARPAMATPQAPPPPTSSTTPQQPGGMPSFASRFKKTS